MKKNTIIFYAYFIWVICAMPAMSMGGLEIVFGVPREIVNFFEISFFVVTILESLFAIVAMFLKCISKTDKYLLLPLLFSFPCMVLYCYNFA